MLSEDPLLSKMVLELEFVQGLQLQPNWHILISRVDVDVWFRFGWASRKSWYKYDKYNDHSKEGITHVKGN